MGFYLTRIHARLAWFYLACALLTPIGVAQSKSLSVQDVTLGKVVVGREGMPLPLHNMTWPGGDELPHAGITFQPDPKSLQWIRVNEVLLLPRVWVTVHIPASLTADALHYAGTIYPLHVLSSGDKEAGLYVSLFHQSPIALWSHNKKLASWQHQLPAPTVLSVYIDPSCLNFGLKLNTPFGGYLSAGCRGFEKGRFGHTSRGVEVYWASPNLIPQGGQAGGHVALFEHSATLSYELSEKTLKITTQYNEHSPRLRLAWGAGPYTLNTQAKNLPRNKRTAPALFLYGNARLDKENSIRFFNALVSDGGALFNNAGLYYANHLTDLWDHRLELTSLLGVQALTFRADSGRNTNNRLITPQGFELVWRHVAGIPHYLVAYGMFINTASDYDYSNVWLRWGRHWFWELNYLRWSEQDSKAEMMGVSVGLPLASFW